MEFSSRQFYEANTVFCGEYAGQGSGGIKLSREQRKIDEGDKIEREKDKKGVGGKEQQSQFASQRSS